MDQKKFDEAVNETMDLLDMDYSEALKDTIDQFQQMVRNNWLNSGSSLNNWLKYCVESF